MILDYAGHAEGELREREESRGKEQQKKLVDAQLSMFNSIDTTRQKKESSRCGKEGAGGEVARMTSKVSATRIFVGTVGKLDIGKMNAKKKKRGVM